MFEFLAEEESKHYEKIREFYRREFFGSIKFKLTSLNDFVKNKIFSEKVSFRGEVNEKSDALDALNIDINAEKESIKLYSKLSDEEKKQRCKRAFRKTYPRRGSALENFGKLKLSL